MEFLHLTDVDFPVMLVKTQQLRNLQSCVSGIENQDKTGKLEVDISTNVQEVPINLWYSHTALGTSLHLILRTTRDLF